MRRRSLSPVRVVSLIVLLLFALPTASAAVGVVINEVLYDPEGPDTGLEFVEILNCGRRGVSLSGWTLESGNGADPDDWTVEWIGGDLDFLAPGEFLLIGESSVLPEPDFVTALDLQNGPDGLRLTDGSAPVDVVGWGEPLFHEYYEGTPAVDCASGSSLARSPDCYDHDDNSVDFLASPVPTPGRGNSPGRDLALRVVHAGNTILEPGPAAFGCVVTNTGALDAPGGASIVVLSLDGSVEPSTSAEIAQTLSPRDTLAVVLECELSRGYHRASLRVVCPGDEEPSNDVGETTRAVGGPGGALRLSEVMYSPDSGRTEWVEFQSMETGHVDVRDWLLGDDGEQHPLEVAADGGMLGPSSFVVIASDTSDPGLSGCAVLGARRWEALSAADVVVLLDEFGTPIERVAYDDSWGGGRGVSLERVRIDALADDPCNWGSSVDPGGSTPCARNSIYLPVSPSSGGLQVSPNPFTPDGDGDNDRMAISYELPVARASVRISVYDSVGRVRRTLMDGGASSSRGEVLWDGSDGAGALLPSGLYIVRLEAINAREGVLVDEKKALGLVR